ncbi:MAG: cell division FtsA domain-containing protein [Eubacteriales bacterium]
MSQSELIFALDIGTRSVIGVVGEARGEMFHVLYMAKEEHVKRAMMDGQIEDIDQVAKIVTIVKERLEEQIGSPLSRVCVAAAGRSLRMERAHAMVELSGVETVTDDYISQLEAIAIADAESKLSEHHKDQRFYLVGYTVAQYLLDRYPMTTIKGHNGRIMEAEVVATFLPSQVVEGLYSVVQIAGLEVASLTLEPIAALNATIPPDLRLLNLVLVDIGAGTSDIAVCRDGSVVGYTMATIAGDEITEMLMRHFLIDFKTAESLKTNLSAGEIKYINVLGIEENTTGHQISEAVSEATKNLVKEIAKQIRAINGCSPAAVFMAGGGSKLEGITEMLAGYLEIQSHRIAVAGSNYNRTIASENYQLEDPEYATPLGIAVSAGLGLINDSYHITLNGKGAKLFRSGTLSLLDILMMNGFTAADLIGRTGKNLALMINGNKKIIRGKASIPGILRLNGEASAAGAVVSAGDSIEFVPAIDGESATCTLQELLGDYAGKVQLNGEEVPWSTPLKSGDSVTTINSTTTPTVAGRRNPRPLTASELQPVDTEGNPVSLPEDTRSIQRGSMGLQTDFTILSEDSASPFLEPDVKIYGGDNITPIPITKPQSAVTSQVEKPVIKPMPESKSAVEFPKDTVPSAPVKKASPSPVTPPVAPVATPVAPVATPVEPVATPVAPVATPVEPVATPVAPVATPVAPVATPVEPVATPVEPVATPVEPVATPVEPVATPVEPVATPIEPVATPVKPVATPVTPTEVAEKKMAEKAPSLEKNAQLENTAPLPKSIQEQLPDQEAPVMPTGPLPSLSKDFTEIPAEIAEKATSPKENVEAPPSVKPAVASAVKETAPVKEEKKKAEEAPVKPAPPKPEGGRTSLTQGIITLNGSVIQLPPKVDGSPYYLMDLLDKTDIDFRRVSKPILMLVNGQEGFFVQHLHENDNIIIEEQQ